MRTNKILDEGADFKGIVKDIYKELEQLRATISKTPIHSVPDEVFNSWHKLQRKVSEASQEAVALYRSTGNLENNDETSRPSPYPYGLDRSAR